MLSLNRILIPVDFSERCLAMMPYVRCIAERFDSEVILLHVSEPFYTIPPTGFSGPVLVPVPQRVLDAKNAQLEEFAQPELKGLKVRRLVYEGDPVAQILSSIDSEAVDLVALPTRSAGALRRFLLGSVTSKILHDTPKPVFTGVHLEESPVPLTEPFSQIVCGIDLGPQSEEVLRWAAQFAEGFRSRLSVVHVLTALSPALSWSPPPDLTTQQETPAREELEKLCDTVGLRSANVEILTGDAARTLCSFAQTISAGALVIGRGPQDQPSGRLASNAYAVVRQAPCPVVSV